MLEADGRPLTFEPAPSATHATMGVWVTLLRVATTIAQCGMILSPGPDIIKVHKHKSTGEVAALPLVAMVVNNYLWWVLCC